MSSLAAASALRQAQQQHYRSRLALGGRSAPAVPAARSLRPAVCGLRVSAAGTLGSRLACNVAAPDSVPSTSAPSTTSKRWSWDDDGQLSRRAVSERWTPASLHSAGVAASDRLLLSFTAAFGGATALGSGFGLEGPASLAQAAAVLATIIAVHEWGHFLAATKQGIHVTKFAIGFGPALWTYNGKDGVEYSFRAIPLGGYVAFPEDSQPELSNTEPQQQQQQQQQEQGKGMVQERVYAPDDPDLLKNRSIPERGLVISAGIIANVIFAYLTLLVQVSTLGKAESAYLPGVKVPEVAAGSAAARAGLRAGDVVMKVDGVAVPPAASQVSSTVAAIKASAGREMVFTVQRSAPDLGGPAPALVDVAVTPDSGPDGAGKIGVQLTANVTIEHTHPEGPVATLAMTQSEFNRLAGTVAKGLQNLFTNFGSVSSQLSGPIAIVAQGSEIARTDSAGLFQFCAIININLALVNLLPLPGLDGGFLVLLGLEAARGGKKLPAALEQGVLASGFLLIMTAGIGLIVRDTLNLLPQ